MDCAVPKWTVGGLVLQVVMLIRPLQAGLKCVLWGVVDVWWRVGPSVKGTPAAVLKLRQFCSPYFVCVFRKTLKVVGPFYLVYVPGDEKDPTQGVNV